MHSDIKTIPVSTDPPYTITIGAGLLQECGEHVRPHVKPCRMAIVTDSNVAPLYLQVVVDSLQRAGYSVCSYVFPAGEGSKTLATLGDLLEFFASSSLTRSDCAVALGGGVCGDITGFAAAVYLRGIRFLQIPTTLLACVDSSVGGKTAVDLKAGKNLAGAFLQPSAVICDTDCLQTLSPHFLADGCAEAIKTGVLSGEPLFSLFETGDSCGRMPEIIAQCAAYKASVVARDERDEGVRRTLNLGHTIGHAIEKCSDYSITHGHAVAVGMALMARASDKLGWCATPCANRIEAALKRHKLPVTTDFSAERLAKAALADKKRHENSVALVVTRQIGDCAIKDVDVADLEAVFRAGMEG